MATEPKTAPSTPAHERRAAPWLISMAVHALILWVFAVLTWVVATRGQAEQVITLEPGGGGGAGGLRLGAAAAQRTEQRKHSEAPSTVVPPAPPPAAIAAEIDEALLVAPEPSTATSADPMRELIAASGSPGSGGGTGGGVGTGTGAGFGQHIGNLRQKGLDVVLVIDATNSMGPYIAEAKKRLQAVVDVITGLVPGTRFGIVAYKDYGDDYGPDAVRSMPLTDDINLARQFITDVVAAGGGDLPEPIHMALKYATDRKTMGWGTGRKHVIILVGDSPVHSGGREEATKLAQQFAGRGGTINVLDAGTAASGQGWREQVQPDLLGISRAGKGAAFLLREQDAFWEHLIIATFDQRYRQDVEEIIRKYVKER